MSTTMIEDVLAIPDHIRDALWRCQTADLDRFQASGMLVCGMGGSAVGGDLARAILGDRLSGSFEVCRSGALPPWSGPETAALVVSYSGETDEALTAFDRAGASGLHRWVVTTGGSLGELARDAGVGVVGLPGFLQPRASVAYTTVAAAVAAAHAGISPDIEEEFLAAADALDAATPELRALASGIAQRLGERPTVIHGQGTTVPVARRWATQLNENAKRFAFAAEMPEASHNLIEAWVGDRTGFNAVFLEEPRADPADRVRFEAAREVIADAGVETQEIQSGGETRAEAVLRAVMLGDLVSLDLAERQGVEPGPVRAIERFKALVGESGK
jgi:glucose/mannose-6-phosphate isomerase